MKNLLIWVGIIIIVLIIIGLFVGCVDKNNQSTSSNKSHLSNVAKEAASEPVKAEEAQAAVDAAAKKTTIASQAEQDALAQANEVAAQNSSKFTTSQLNAIHSAQAYLSYAFFSRKGLIHLLSSRDGNEYSVADATIAVDSLDIDWNQQAVGVAKDYLDSQEFSCKELINKMSSDHGSKFTVQQATYGAQQAGACS